MKNTFYRFRVNYSFYTNLKYEQQFIIYLENYFSGQKIRNMPRKSQKRKNN